MFCMEKVNKIKCKRLLVNIVFWRVHFDGKQLFLLLNINNAQAQSVFQPGLFRGWLQAPRSQGLLFLSRPSMACPSQHSPCLQKICRMKKWLPCTPSPLPPPQTLQTAIKNSKAKTVFLTFFPPPDIRKQNKTSKQTERFNLDLWDLARGWQLELRFQRRLTKAASVPEKGRLRIFLSSEAAIADSHPKPWNVVAWLPNLLALDNPLNSEYIYLI